MLPWEAMIFPGLFIFAFGVLVGEWWAHRAADQLYEKLLEAFNVLATRINSNRDDADWWKGSEE